MNIDNLHSSYFIIRWIFVVLKVRQDDTKWENVNPGVAAKHNNTPKYTYLGFGGVVLTIIKTIRIPKYQQFHLFFLSDLTKSIKVNTLYIECLYNKATYQIILVGLKLYISWLFLCIFQEQLKHL